VAVNDIVGDVVGEIVCETEILLDDADVNENDTDLEND
jgi:hypothetical protein